MGKKVHSFINPSIQQFIQWLCKVKKRGFLGKWINSKILFQSHFENDYLFQHKLKLKSLYFLFYNNQLLKLRNYNNYQGNKLSTMKKKSLDTNIGVEDYNNKVFKKSMQLIGACKKIPINQVSNLHRQPGVKQKYNAIEQKLQSILKILRVFTDAQKPPFNNPIDLSSEILQETKLKVDIQFRKAQQQKNTVKAIKNQLVIKKSRPQQKYPDIKIYQNFDQHYHQNYVQDGIIPQLKICQQIQPPSDINNQYFYIDTVQKLDKAIKQMKQCDQLAVDVQHSSKSYQGFTCLIQISSRTKDYIIDVFPIWSSVPALQQVIGNPKILKVLHGAQMDTKWLQRDFNIHIVNLFDTHKASRVLGMSKFSYAFLLNHYCSIQTNKVYQRADWRQRPLIQQMVKYARIDTHYLLTIYDHLMQDLQKQARTMNLSLKDILRDIQKSSHQVSLLNVQLFSYKTKQQYITLQIQFRDKKEEFKAIQSLFSQINYVALKEDQNFDDLISKDDLWKALSFIKDLSFNQKSKISKQTRIQKIITILQKSGNQFLSEAIYNIKNNLISIFCGAQLEYTPNRKQISRIKLADSVSKQKVTNFSTPEMDIENIPQFIRIKNQSVKFQQLPFKTFQPNTNTKISSVPTNLISRPKINFIPITTFLSSKYGIQQIKQNQDAIEQQEQSQPIQDMQQQNNIKDEEDDRQGKIQFKRMNPNVIYTIQEQEDKQVVDALEYQKPRKAKKQSQYQNRIRNKTGNIFDLLGST